jgi:hypothetical protein
MRGKLRKKMTLMSDLLSRQVFNGNTTNAQEILRILLSEKDLQVVSCHVQEIYQGKKDIVLDIVAKDKNNRTYDIEIQNKIMEQHTIGPYFIFVE